jgi:hypothetical protein
LLNHTDKKIKIDIRSGDVNIFRTRNQGSNSGDVNIFRTRNQGSNSGDVNIFIPKIKVDDNVLKNISEFLDKDNKSDECFGVSESYSKRLVVLTPKFNYRYYDKLENFYRTEGFKVENPEIKTFGSGSGAFKSSGSGSGAFKTFGCH